MAAVQRIRTFHHDDSPPTPATEKKAVALVALRETAFLHGSVGSVRSSRARHWYGNGNIALIDKPIFRTSSRNPGRSLLSALISGGITALAQRRRAQPGLRDTRETAQASRGLGVRLGQPTPAARRSAAGESRGRSIGAPLDRRHFHSLRRVSRHARADGPARTTRPFAHLETPWERWSPCAARAITHLNGEPPTREHVELHDRCTRKLVRPLAA
jgi:hypothetical protein